jgi:hypothetical protein
LIKIIIFILLINISILTASAEEWDSATFTLSMENPAAYKGNYSLEVLDFDGYGMAGLNITWNGIFIGIASLENNDTDWFYMDNGSIRLKSENITDRRVLPMFGSLNSPRAKFTFATQKTPGNPTSLALSISLDKKEYLLDQEIIATIDIRNVGDTKTNDISLNLNSYLLMQGSPPASFSLDEGEQKSVEIKFKFPPISKASYNIVINGSWSDTHSARYFIEDSQTVQLELPLRILKSATGDVKLGNKAFVSLSVENVQTIPLRVSLNDALPVSFTPVNGTVTNNKTDLRWEFDLAPGENKVFTYQMNSSQIGAHRLPNAHISYMWGGEEYTNSSKTENIILVYKGLSYKEQETGIVPDTLTELDTTSLIEEVNSGKDFSKWVDNSSGITRKDIKVNNDTLNVSIFIPKGTKILNANNTPLTRITIEEEAKPPNIPSNLIMAGRTYYHLGPDGATFNPFISFNVPFNPKVTDSPSIYRYNGNWTSVGGIVNGSRVYTNLINFSVYAVLEESSPEVVMSAIIRSAISIEVTPSDIDFGELAPGESSRKIDLTIKNNGASNISVTGNVTDEAGNLYADGLFIDEKPWRYFSLQVLKNVPKTTSMALKVSQAYEGVGSKNGSLMFWAERSKNQ